MKGMYKVFSACLLFVRYHIIGTGYRTYSEKPTKLKFAMMTGSVNLFTVDSKATPQVADKTALMLGNTLGYDIEGYAITLFSDSMYYFIMGISPDGHEENIIMFKKIAAPFERR